MTTIIFYSVDLLQSQGKFPFFYFILLKEFTGMEKFVMEDSASFLRFKLDTNAIVSFF